AERERLAASYAERLGSVVGLPSADEGDRHGWQAYVVRTAGRDRALDALAAAGIQGQIGTYALHRLAAYADQGPFPGADEAFTSALALPFHNRLTQEDLDQVAEVLTSVVSE
ncbi:MAG TPA: DegT/DnrJ/EryC1/StrS family aminotransferase, partial [Gaiellaceae bacterium]|nr:DegT/DnrJ/EryC1/StrS family aminotransferase [Gaiellaceae bacterium]